MRRIATRVGIWGLPLVMALGVILYLHGRPIEVRPSDILSVRIVPIPEGPPVPPFEGVPTDPYSRPLSLISEAIPIPLPHPAWQFRCSMGGNLEIQLRNGRRISYGPCRLPRSIKHLWAVMLDVVEGGRCRPNCGPGGDPGP